MNEPITVSSMTVNRRVQFNVIGWAVLILGLGIASRVYWSGRDPLVQPATDPSIASAEGGWQDSSLAPGDSKKARRDLELYYGKMSLLIQRWEDLVEALKRPESAALLIATIAALTAAGCFFAARRPPRTGPPHLALQSPEETDRPR